ncbi:unnamed protein product, partial [Mesorhabditis spiculigera]
MVTRKSSSLLSLQRVGALTALIIGIYQLKPVVEKRVTRAEYEPKYKGIADAYHEILQKENQGSTVAILHHGKLVFDMQGGWADIEAGREWSEDIMTVSYSCTKLIGALSIATLVSRGHLDYHEKVTKYWPEFGQHGKENVTVDQLVNHQAGLITFGKDFTLAEAKDDLYISRLIEESRPHWKPGQHIGYHALTYGFLLDQLFQRADPLKRNIAQFYEEEVRTNSENGDFYLGLPRELLHRKARISPTLLSQTLLNFATHPSLTMSVIGQNVRHGGLAFLSADSPRFMSVIRTDMLPYNNIDVLELPSISALGIGTAAGFAHVVRQFWIGQVIPETFWKGLEGPELHGMDIVLGLERHMNHGFYYRPIDGTDKYTIGFTGNGGQFIDIDKGRDLIIVFLCNGLQGGLGSSQYEQLRQKILEVLDSE